jgi:hypothetical protein
VSRDDRTEPLIRDFDAKPSEKQVAKLSEKQARIRRECKTRAVGNVRREPSGKQDTETLHYLLLFP